MKTDFKYGSKSALPYIKAISFERKNNRIEGIRAIKKAIFIDLINKPLFFFKESKVPVNATNAAGKPKEKHITKSWFIVNDKENNP